MIEAEPGRQGTQPTVGHFVAHEAAREGQRVDDRVAERRTVAAQHRGIDERHVEPDVVADDHRVADELLQGGQDRLDPRCRPHHHLGDAGEHRDRRRDGTTGVHQRRHGAEALATLHLDHTDLGDEVGTTIAAGGLDVEYAEGDIRQGSAEIVE